MAFADRDRYERFSRFVPKSSLTEDAWSIFAAMGEWFKANPDSDVVNWSGFGSWYVLVRHAKMQKEKLAAHKQLIKLLSEREPADDDTIHSLLDGLTRREYASKVADISLRIADGDHTATFEAIDRVLREYDRVSGASRALEGKVGSFSVDAIRSTFGPGLQWSLDALQSSIGPIRKGDFGVFGKRPDAGGTTFLASEVSYMAEQIEDDECILWINNEEEGQKVRTRIMQAVIGWSTEAMEEDPEGAFEEYVAILGNPQKIVVFDDSKAHIKDVETLLKTLKPRLVIIDQLWKMKGGELKGEEGYEHLSGLFNWARGIAKDWAPVLAVHQLGVEAENRKWNGYETLYGSKTAIQGEADFILIMGRVYANGFTRYIWAPKNKQKTPGDKTKRNAKWEITIEPDIARYADKAFVSL